MLNGLADIDLSSPIDWTHPDNAGLSVLLLGLPGVSGGERWPDLTGKTAGGTLVNGPTWVATPYDQSAISFDGVNDYADVPLSISDRMVWTVALWLCPAQLTAGVYVGDHTNTVNAANVRALICGFQAGCYNVFNQGYPTGNAADTQITASGVGKWDRLVYTTDGTRIRGYLNGVKKVDVGASLTSSTAPAELGLQIGRPYGTNSNYFSGKIGGWAEYSRVVDDGWAARDYQWAQSVRLRTFSRRAWLFVGGAAGSRTADMSLTGSAYVAATATVAIAADTALYGNASVAGSSVVTITADTALYGSATLLFDGGGIVADVTGQGSATVAASASVTVGASAALLGTASDGGSGVVLIGATAAVQGNATPAASVAVTITADTALYGHATITIQAGAAAEVFTYIDAGAWFVAGKSAEYSVAAKSAAWGVAMPGVPIRNVFLPQDIVINSKFGFNLTLYVSSDMPDPATWSSVRMSVGTLTVDCNIGTPVVVAQGWKVPLTANFSQANTAGLTAGTGTFQIDFTSPTMEDMLVEGTCNIVTPSVPLP